MIIMCAICGFTECPDGCPNHPETIILCPECGRECEDLYLDARSGQIIGCDRCVRKVEAAVAMWK